MRRLSKLSSLRRAESQRAKRKKIEQSRRSFFENPHRYTKKLFEQSKSGEFNIPKQELEDHRRQVCSDEYHQAPLPDIARLIRPSHSGVAFDVSEPKLKLPSSSIKLEQDLHQGQMEFRTKSTRNVRHYRRLSGGC